MFDKKDKKDCNCLSWFCGLFGGEQKYNLREDVQIDDPTGFKYETKDFLASLSTEEKEKLANLRMERQKLLQGDNI